MFGTVLYVTAFCTVFAPWPRYSIPYRPVLFLAVASALAGAAALVAARRGARVGADAPV